MAIAAGSKEVVGEVRVRAVITAGAAPPSRVIPVSLLTEHDGLIRFEERPIDHRLGQSVPLQYLIIEPDQNFELCERCVPKVLV